MAGVFGSGGNGSGGACGTAFGTARRSKETTSTAAGRFFGPSLRTSSGIGSSMTLWASRSTISSVSAASSVVSSMSFFGPDVLRVCVCGVGSEEVEKAAAEAPAQAGRGSNTRLTSSALNRAPSGWW